MRRPLPPASSEALRAALSTEAGLRAWWDPEAVVRGASGETRILPGLDGPEMRVRVHGERVEWEGELLAASFDLSGREVSIPAASSLDPADAAELGVALALALATLDWALSTGPGPVAWERRTYPLALAYTDAWGRIDGSDGLGGGAPAAEVPLRIGALRFRGTRRLVVAPRAVVVEVDGDLLRVAFGPGSSVNTAFVDRIFRVGGQGGGLPHGWSEALEQRLGMTWVAQLGEEST